MQRIAAHSNRICAEFSDVLSRKIHASVAVCCRVLQCVEVCCRVLPCVAVCCNVSQCVAVCCSVLQCVVQYEGCPHTKYFQETNAVVQGIAVCINSLQHVSFATFR